MSTRINRRLQALEHDSAALESRLDANSRANLERGARVERLQSDVDSLTARQHELEQVQDRNATASERLGQCLDALEQFRKRLLEVEQQVSRGPVVKAAPSFHVTINNSAGSQAHQHLGDGS